MNAWASRPCRAIRFAGVLAALAILAPVMPSVRGADLDEVRPLFIKGEYARCIEACQEAIADRELGEEWRLLLAESLMAVGRYTNALDVVQTNLTRYPWSVQLRLLAHEVFRRNGRAEEAAGALDEINRLGGYRMWAYQDTPNLITMGKAAVLLGADPRRVLEQFFDLAKKRDATNRLPYLASGQLALDKNDYDLAAKTLAAGLKIFPLDPDLHFGMAQAYAPSDRRLMIAALEAALNANPNHVPSHLLLVDHLVDGEEYKAAEESIKKALEVNPHHPEAWAYRAVIAHLKNELAEETKARDTALAPWKTNPEVDHLIGRKLSQKYRFAEGATYQRRALRFEPRFLQAKIQLSQDLLRLGEEDEGWRLAEEVHSADAYDVTAFNLTTLQESMAKFTTLTNADFILRMATNEAVIYGQRALALLTRAKTNLCAKYGLELTTPTIVEIFPNQKDFGVRTFGMPGNPGYLGVCFGPVITANSPASQAGHPANWEAVLWHEFCHVVTLGLTKNKMPRWLSEGISVYEELQENPVWGQGMTPRYREMILGKDFTPLGELSAAFLAPKTEMHLQFAYYESYLAVEFLVKQFGLEALKKILRDLGEGTEINTAIVRHTAPLEKVEADFEKFAKERAEKLAPELSFEKPEPGDEGLADVSKNFYVLTRHARKLLRERKYAEAKAPLETLIKLFPGNTGADNAYWLLAEAHRGLNETNAERLVLTTLAGLEADDVDTYSRLMELSAIAKDWGAVATNAQRHLAVNPLVAQPYRHLAQASEALGRRDEGISACQTLLLLDPPDPAGAHFQLARLLHEAGNPGAKRHLLQALEEAPRFREGHKLLLEMTKPAKPTQPDSTPPNPAPSQSVP
jgi:tetratricopeptide (TPR) repeat protein